MRHRRASRAKSSTTRSASKPASTAPMRSCKAERARVAERHLIEGLQRRPGLAAHLQHLVGFVGRLQQRIAGAAADVGRQRDAHARLVEPPHVEQARAQEQIGRRAERGHAPLRRERGDLGVLQMDAMAEDRFRAEQAEALVDVEIVARLRKQLLGQAISAWFSLEMRLHVARRDIRATSAPAAASCASRRGDREARRDRIAEPAAAAPALDQRLAFVIAALRGVGQRGRRVAVHHHLARDHARAALLACREERVDRFRPHGAIDHRRRRALAEHLVEEEFARPRRHGAGSENFCSSTNVYFCNQSSSCAP